MKRFKLKTRLLLCFLSLMTSSAIADTGRFSLSEFVRNYLTRATIVGVQQESINSSSEKINYNKAQFLPTTTLNAEATKTDSLGSEHSRLIDSKIQTSSFLKVTQNIYNGNKDAANFRSAKTLFEKDKAAYESTRYDEILKAIDLYYGYLKAKVDYDNISKETETNTKILADLRKNFLNGNAKKSQVLSVQATIASNEVDKLEAANALKKAIIMINRDLGTNYDSFELSVDNADPAFNVNDLNYSARADLLTFKLNSESLYQQIEVSRASQRPKIDLSGSYYIHDSSEVSNNKNYYSVILGVSIPFPWGMEKKTLVSQARIEHNISLLNEKIKEDALEKERRLLVEDITSLKERMVEIGKAKKIAEDTVSLLRKDFLSGLSSYSDYQNGSTSYQQILRKFDQIKLDYEQNMVKAEIWSGNVDKILK